MTLLVLIGKEVSLGYSGTRRGRMEKLVTSGDVVSHRTCQESLSIKEKSIYIQHLCRTTSQNVALESHLKLVCVWKFGVEFGVLQTTREVQLSETYKTNGVNFTYQLYLLCAGLHYK